MLKKFYSKQFRMSAQFSFVYTQLNVKGIQFQAIQPSKSTQFGSI